MEARLTDLEIKVAYLERLVGELDGVVRTLSDELDRMRNQMAELRRADLESEERPANEKPPHY